MAAKVKTGASALRIVGMIFSLIGTIFCAIAIMTLVSLSGDVEIVGFIFLLIGGIFLILGVVFLAILAAKRNRSQKLIDEGRFVWGTIADCVYDFNVNINGTHPYKAIVRYCDGRGMTHIFKSDNINRYPDHSLIGRTVRVYVSSENMKHYYVDMQSILSEYIEH